jgi:hypothetical protein
MTPAEACDLAILEAALAAWRVFLDLPVEDKRRAVELLAKRIEIEIASWELAEVDRLN